MDLSAVKVGHGSVIKTLARAATLPALARGPTLGTTPHVIVSNVTWSAEMHATVYI